MMRALIRFLVSLVVLAVSTAAFAGLPGSISGTWYNPAQSGHGLSLDVLADNRAIAIWHVFDPNGQPLTLYIEAQIDGRRLSGPAYAPRGMRFGSFDPAQLQLPVWGEVEISFGSCDQAELSWRSTQPGFPDGRMPLVRLVQVLGRECVVLPGMLPGGLYIGELDVGGSNLPRTLEGLVDADGRLWGFDRADIPGAAWQGAYVPKVYRIEPTATDGAEVSASGALLPALAFTPADRVSHSASSSGVWRVGTQGPAQGEFSVSNAAIGVLHRWRAGAPVNRTLVAPVDMAVLRGQYTFKLRSQFFPYVTIVKIEADGSVCITDRSDEFGPCAMRGTVTTPEGRVGLIDFTLSDVSQPVVRSYSGRGWLLDTPSGRELILVGDNGTVGLLVAADAR